MRRALLCLLLASARCGARTDLGGVQHGDAGLAGVCSNPPPAPKSCTTWTPGAPKTIADAGALADVIASGCGALVAWSTSTSTSMAWSTRWIDFDGTMLAPAVAHPSLTAQTIASGAMSLASDGSTIGMLEADTTGCRFMTADTTGHELSAPQALGALGCVALAHVSSAWTFLRDDEKGGVSLVTIENGGTSEKQLELASPQVLWDRLVLADGSFLLDTFFEDSSANYTDSLTPYDATGKPLGPTAFVGGFDAAPVLLARAGTAALAAWHWSTIEAVPIGPLGKPTGAQQMISSDQPIYELSIISAPNGDVLMVWMLLEPDNSMSLFARALAPDGTPRGPKTLLASDVGESQVFGAVETTGARAVLALESRDGVLESLALTCQ